MNNQINNVNVRKGKHAPTKFHNVKTSYARRVMDEVSVNDDQSHAAEAFPIKRLLNNRILSSLPDGDFERLLPDLEPVSLSAGEHLCKPDEQFDWVYFPEDSIVSHLRVLENGNSSEIAVVGKDGIVGLSAVFAGAPPSYWTEVLIGGTALRIRIDRLKAEFNCGGALQSLLLNFASEQFDRTAQRAVCNNHHVVEERLCNWLLTVLDRAAYNQLPLTQDQIARHLGVHRPGITLAALSLREKGLIDYSRGNLSIVDRDGLEQLSCECYATVKENLFAH
jgi:CRP-like cAMP-binding protein